MQLDVGNLKSKINGFRKGIIFGIKCYFTRYPLVLITVLFTLFIMLFALAVRYMEYKSNASLNGRDFTSYINALWFVGATMTTVGYGDFTPNTVSGRFNAYFIFLTGLFLISLTFGTVMNFIKLSLPE